MTFFFLLLFWKYVVSLWIFAYYFLEGFSMKKILKWIARRISPKNIGGRLFLATLYGYIELFGYRGTAAMVVEVIKSNTRRK